MNTAEIKKTPPRMTEETIHEISGVSRAQLRKLRDTHMVKDEHWVIQEKHTTYTDAGLTLLWKLLGMEAMSHDIGQLLNPVWKPQIFELKVSKKKARRPDFIIGEDAEGNEFYVRVRSKENFVIGMEFKARTIRENNTCALLGRCPRWRGRW